MLKHRNARVFKTWWQQPPSGGCVLKQLKAVDSVKICTQPPSGGCVLKHRKQYYTYCYIRQPPSGGCVLKLTTSISQHGCVLKLYRRNRQVSSGRQPPSGGCVLKQQWLSVTTVTLPAAAFGRLCVETIFLWRQICWYSAAAFGRLCVETR